MKRGPAIKAVVITLSDKGSKGLRTDESGPLVSELLSAIGACVLHYEMIPDDPDRLRESLIRHSALADLINTNGSTGLGPRDIAPETTAAVIDREVPGIAEAMRARGMKNTGRAMLSRGLAGTRGKCLIINLPGSPRAVRECLEAVLETIPHALSMIKGSGEDCAR
ncbi:MAG: MogA/MoaB family molybdenum cofactor biosynthesis protein [Nitrospiraceae bacterium]|nr:MogA/MoaB family molybdenum cofactor biosynthesis protein [Nitrospiraceae bacterium]